MDNKCHCIIKHPDNEQEREAIKKALDAARKTGDATGTVLAIAQLTGRCPAKGQ